MAFAYENLIRVIPDHPKPGVVYQDITPVFSDARAFEAMIDDIADHFASRGLTKVIGAEARGFILGAGVALRLDLGFVTARKAGKLPVVGFSASYNLEYGHDSLELPADTLTSADTVLIVDDLLATGGTARAIAEMVKASGARLGGFGFFVELADEGGRANIAKLTGAEVYATCLR